MQKKRYSEQDLRTAVSSSISFAEVLRKIGLIPAGGNYQNLKTSIKNLEIDTSHFKKQAWAKDKLRSLKTPLSDYTSNKKSIRSTKYKNRLLREGVLEPICSSCKLTTWLGKPAPLELDHIDGDNKNNSLDNVRLLCPNCHAFTDTYRGRNIGKNNKE